MHIVSLHCSIVGIGLSSSITGRGCKSTGAARIGSKGIEAHLLGLLAQVGDQIVPVLALLETTEGHLCAWDVLLWVLEVLELSSIISIHLLLRRWISDAYQSVLLPHNTLRLVRIGVREALN
jgi:hypothetical protein